MLESLFNKVALQHRCFTVKFAKFLRTPSFTEHHGGCFRYCFVHQLINTFHATSLLLFLLETSGNLRYLKFSRGESRHEMGYEAPHLILVMFCTIWYHMYNLENVKNKFFKNVQMLPNRAKHHIWLS